MKRKRDEEIEEENKETIEKRRKMMKEKDKALLLNRKPCPSPFLNQQDNMTIK